MKEFRPDKGLHKIVDGMAIRTETAIRRERHIAYKRAGVPDIHLDTSLEELAETSVWKRLPTTNTPKRPVFYWIEADAMNSKAIASWTYLLKSYIDAGKQARHAKIKHIIDAQFDNAEKSHWRNEIRSLDLFVVDMTNTDSHKMLPSLLADIHAERLRARVRTVYLSDDNVGIKVGKYGDLMAKVFKELKYMRRISPRNLTRGK